MNLEVSHCAFLFIGSHLFTYPLIYFETFLTYVAQAALKFELFFLSFWLQMFTTMTR